MNIKVEQIKTWQHYAYAAYVRTLVFIQEQNCPAKNEFDPLEDEAMHFLCWVNDELAGTARCRILEGQTGKIERIAVLKHCRGQGAGRALVLHIESILKRMPDISFIVMSAQDHALPFYEKLGYQVIGAGYMEEGIAHHKIEMRVK
ncbi:MAG: GNAT family N-acetyltransferase [Methyloprofundus sp.]|nr:GNAT family N-acetyltransferase [Methyloprofundus sp.]